MGGAAILQALAGLMIIGGPVHPPYLATAHPVYQVREYGFYSGAWRVEREWDEEGEEEFSRWVETIGRAREKKVFRLAQGLKNPAINPLYSEEDKTLNFEADCATFAYALRAYFAYKTHRPFTWVHNKGRRYKAGNKPLEFRDFSQYQTFRRFFNAALGAVSSAHFRMHASLEGTDTYPISITPESVRPGVTYYDPNGHVLVVYRVDRLTGEIYMFDGHPDGTMTRKVFGPKLARGTARFGGGFRAWRRCRVDVIDALAGAFRIIREPNVTSPYFSDTAQYQKSYTVDGRPATYHEWVRTQVRLPLLGAR
jgi:hypothetical protein